MMIDCDSCTVRGAACTDCVVTFLTIPVRSSAPGGGATPRGRAGVPGGRHAPGPGAGCAPCPAPTAPTAVAVGGPVDLDDAERAAIEVLASSGLVPPLRMVRAV